MPSDARLQPALEALRRPIAAYRSYVAAARERVRTLLASDHGVDRARHELGPFGASRIDAARFAALQRGVALEPLARARLDAAAAVLGEIDAADDSIFTANVAPGDSLRVTAARALARTGRAFGAATLVELVRSGRYDAERHDRLLESFAYDWWTRTEREHAPPLVVSVDGADLRAGSLAEVLDVGMHLVLLVRGASTPAPLVRLLTPGTLVIQTGDVRAIGSLGASPGPAIAAVFEQEAAFFTHDPAAGSALWQRLTILRRPASAPAKTLAGISQRQQREELLQLEALAERPALPAGYTAPFIPEGTGDPTDRLTAWLLTESGLASGQ